MRRMSKKHGGSQSSHLNDLSIEDLQEIANALGLSFNGSQTKQQLIDAIDKANGTEVSRPEQEPEMKAQTFEHQLTLATQQCHKCYEELLKNTDATSDRCKILDYIHSPEFVNSLSKTLLKAHFTKIGYTSDQIAQGIKEGQYSVKELDSWLQQNEGNPTINVKVCTLDGKSCDLGRLPISSNVHQVKTKISTTCSHKLSSIVSLTLNGDCHTVPKELTENETQTLTLYDLRTYCTPEGIDPKDVQSIELILCTYVDENSIYLKTITLTSEKESGERGNTDYTWRLVFTNGESLLIEGKNELSTGFRIIRNYKILEPNEQQKLTQEQYDALQAYIKNNPEAEYVGKISIALNPN